MDRKGQSTVLFILLIPIFLIVVAIIVDTSINMYNEKRLKNITEDVMENLLNVSELKNVTYENRDEILEKLETRAKTIYENNDIDTNNLYIQIMYNERISLSNSCNSYSFMNSLFNRGNGDRAMNVEVEGYVDANGEIVIEFKGDNYEN